MARGAEQRLAHRHLGVLDVPLPVARDAVIDPGISPGGRKLNGGRKGLLRPRRLVEREPRLAVYVMRARLVRRAVAGFARGTQCGLRVALRQPLHGGFQKSIEIVRRLSLRARASQAGEG